MIVAVCPNALFPNSLQLAISIREFLMSKGVTVVAEDSVASEVGATPFSQIDYHQIDILISMGGDGTILGLVHRYEGLSAAILGINLGHLGFMADIPASDIYPSLQELVSGDYVIEERLALDGRIGSGERCFAVNDIVVHRGSNPNLIEMAIHVGGAYLNTFEADGLIIATPNGSTAYSLAAGGPILSPNLDAIVITPISPHTISNRPVVLTASQEIQIQYLSRSDQAEVRADGLKSFTLETGDLFHIQRSAKKFRLVNLRRRDYFSTLRLKLGWSGKLR